MNNPERVLDIPGYFYDTITRRYYKQDLVNPKPKIFTRTQDENVLPESVIKPQRSVLNLLKRRERGFGKYSFENQVISAKSTNLHCVQTKCVNRRQRCEDVEFLKGGKRSLYVEYSNKHQTKYFLEEKLHCFSPPEDTYECFYGTYPESFSTVDMVESPTSGYFLLLIVSNSDSWKVLLQTRCDPSLRQKVHTSWDPIWCCATNEFSNRIVFGEQDNVVVRCCLDGHYNSFKIPVKGQVRSAEFNKLGNSLFTGRHTGHIGNMDLRAKDSIFYFKLHNIGIDETILLSDENYLMCGAFDGMICKIDLRMRKPVCEYIGNVKTPRKYYLSICEPNHLLCASGSDNITRLWNLSSGGEPIRCIKPRVAGSPCRSWLVSDGYKCLVYSFQKGDMYTYDNI